MNTEKSDLTFAVTADEAGERLDRYLALRLGEEYSRSYFKSLIDGGSVEVNEATVKPRYLTRAGDIILVKLKEKEASRVSPQDIPLRILYEDSEIIVVNKPAGMVVHPGAGNKQDTLVNALLHHCGKLADTGDVSRPGIVHRLDKDTSGVIIAVKNDKALRIISRQFQQRTVKKKYIAIVKGRVEPDNGVIDLPLARHETNRKKMDIDPVKGKRAYTRYRVMERSDKFSVLSITLETGRTHQIRVHMKHLGHPVLGDTVYGNPGTIDRQALHAEMIGIEHPSSGEYIEFHAPVPDDMMSIIKKPQIDQ